MVFKEGEKITFSGERGEWVFEKSDYEFDINSTGMLTKWYFFRQAKGRRRQLMKIEQFDLLGRLEKKTVLRV